MDNLPARLQDMPASLAEVADLFGIEAVVALVDHYGGTEIKFPARPPADDHPILKALGDDLGRALCAYYAGGQVYIPHGKRSSTRAEVARLEAAGYDRASIARRLGISQRHVRRSANTPALPANQLKLF